MYRAEKEKVTEREMKREILSNRETERERNWKVNKDIERNVER
jgi:hypothetical protein